jgi:SAM-dependent methyltransferase
MSQRGLAPDGYFDRWYSDRDYRAYVSLLSLIVARASPGALLDVGAGAGFLVEAARRWGIDAIGVDASPEALRVARSRHSEAPVVEADAAGPLPFEDEAFTAVVLNQVIEHLGISKARLALEEAFRVLQPGGLLVLTSPSAANRKEARADPTHVHVFQPSDLRGLVRECGFVDVESFDQALPLLGSSSLGRLAVRMAMRLLKSDRLSASANCLAYRPSHPPTHTLAAPA